MDCPGRLILKQPGADLARGEILRGIDAGPTESETLL